MALSPYQGIVSSASSSAPVDLPNQTLALPTQWQRALEPEETAQMQDIYSIWQSQNPTLIGNKGYELVADLAEHFDSDLVQRVKEAEQRLQRLTKTAEQYSETNQALHAQLSEAERQEATAKEELALIKADAHQMQSWSDAEQKRYTQARQDSQQATSDLAAQQRRFSDAQRLLKKVESEQNDLNGSLSKVQSLLKLQTQELAGINSTCKSLEDSQKAKLREIKQLIE